MIYLMTVLGALAAFNLLLLVHELGHWIVAVGCGYTPQQATIGFGPRMGTFSFKGTKVVFRLVPLGGGIDLPDNQGQQDQEEQRGRACHLSGKARTAILLGGVGTNILLGLALFTTAAVLWGPHKTTPPVIEQILVEKMPPGAKGWGQLPSPVHITQVGTDSITTGGELQGSLLRNSGPITLTDNQNQTYQVSLPADPLQRRKAVRALLSPQPPVIGRVLPKTPAIQAGFQPGDTILQVDNDSIKLWDEWNALLAFGQKDSLTVVVRRQGQKKILHTHVRTDTQTMAGTQIPHRVVGIHPPVEHQPQSGGQALRQGGEKIVGSAQLLWAFLKAIIGGGLGMEYVAGPAKATATIGVALQIGTYELFNLIGLFSITLALLNLLPVPPLDGGVLALLGWEKFRGQPLSAEIKERAYQLGGIIIGTAVLFLLFNDLLQGLLNL